MTARDRLFPRAGIFNSDAWAVADPFLDLVATFLGKTRVDGRATGEAVFVALQNLEDLRVVLIRSERLFQCASDLLGNRSLDTHAFDEEVVPLVLLDRVL